MFKCIRKCTRAEGLRQILPFRNNPFFQTVAHFPSLILFMEVDEYDTFFDLIDMGLSAEIVPACVSWVPEAEFSAEINFLEILHCKNTLA